MSAGLGTRLRPITLEVPKALVPVMGVSVAQFSLDLLQAAEVKNVICNLHYEPMKAKKGLSELDLGQMSLQFSDESREILGSGGGVRTAMELFRDERALVMNADVISAIDLQEMSNFHFQQQERHGVELTLALYRNSGLEAYSEVDFDEQSLLIKDMRRPCHIGWFFGGQYVLERTAFSHLSPHHEYNFITEVLKPLMQRKKVAAYLCQSPWFDLGSPLLMWSTHLHLIKQLETESLPEILTDRLLKHNYRWSEEFWSNQPRQNEKKNMPTGPGYWHASPGQRCPQLPPQTVIYDGWDEKIPAQPGLIWRGRQILAVD